MPHTVSTKQEIFMSNTATIYIAYRRIEGKTPEIIHQFIDQLKTGFEVDLDAGRLSNENDWALAVRNRIEKCDVMCVMVGPTTGDSEWIKQEIQWAQEAGVPLLPITLDEPHQVVQKELEKLGLAHI